MVRWNQPGLTVWPGFGRLSDLREEIDRWFDLPFSEWAQGTQVLSGWHPALDMFETKDNLVVRVELPGMKREEIEVSLHDGCLSIAGERKHEDKNKDSEVYRAERFYGRFQRTVTLPTAVAADKVHAAYKDGILTITLPKTEEAKPKQIDVSVG
jgi:HSP20 family protein